MPRITTVYARQKRWVNVGCDTCGATYYCLVEACGDASDSLLPLSDAELKQSALINLDYETQKKAASFPCPQCGAYPQSHIERVCGIAGRLIVWGMSLALTLILILLLVALAPHAPVWTIFPILLIALVASRLLSRPLVEKLDPNRDMERNRRLAGYRIKAGVMRLKPTDTSDADSTTGV